MFDEIDAELKTTRCPGTGLLRDLMGSIPGPVDHAIDIRARDEISFLDLVTESGIAKPQVNVPMTVGGNRYVADFFWPELQLVVEADDPSHRQPVAAGRDRVRDVEFLLADLDVMRFETHRLGAEPARCMQQLAAG